MTKGIYKIENLFEGIVYIGESNNIEERWIKHKEDLRNNTHHSKQLQKDWNEYGDENNFKFEIIETIPDNLHIIIQQALLYIYEDKYIKQYNSIKNGYNTENTLKEVIDGKKSLFNQPLNQPNKFAKIVINNVLKNIEQNKGVYISPKYKPKQKNKETYVLNENHELYIIKSCMDYKFENEFETMAQVFNKNKINAYKAYQILINVNILKKDNAGSYICLINDDNMFKCMPRSYNDKETNEIKNYIVTYINKKGFEYLLYILLKESKKHNINIFHKKYIKELMSIA